MQFPTLIRYFRDCYEADNKRSSLWNIFHRDVEHRIFFEDSEELLTGFLNQTPVDVEQGCSTKSAAYLYRKEKELIYASFFIIGWANTQEDTKQVICAPVLLHPAEIVESNERIFVTVDLSNRRINSRMLESIQGDDDGDNLTERLDETFGSSVITFDNAAAASQLLEQLVPALDATEMGRYPRLTPERELVSAFNRCKGDRNAGLSILPGSVLALVKKSPDLRGVLNELSEISDSSDASDPLQELLSEPAPGSISTTTQLGRVPAVLSRAQAEIAQSAAANPATLVIGPPGTGKSYTIAALAIEHMSRGETVLIASKMNHAVDVVGNKIEQQFGLKDCVVRGGRKQYLKDLKQYLQQLLSGVYTVEPVDRRELGRLEAELRRLDASIVRLEQKIVLMSRREVTWGRHLTASGDAPFEKLRARIVRWRANRAIPLWEIVELLDGKLLERIHKTRRLLQMLHRRRLTDLLRKHRRDLVAFLSAIRARTDGKQEDLFNIIDFDIILKAFPVWLTNLSDIHEVLPLKRGLFDLAVIDEATQCDIASSIPILQRAKRAVIVGDPHQLRHLSFLSSHAQQDLLTKYGIPPANADRYDYRNKSLLDLANEAISAQDRVSFLDEHYRSTTPIIRFSNDQFYAGSLRIMTEKPGENTSNRLVLCKCSGERGPTGANDLEARSLVEEVIRHVESESRLTQDLCHSIGILSPFRSQIDYISNLISKRLPFGAFERHDLLIGTAHTFQGEERDLMFISLAVGPSSHSSTLRFLERPDVFNVAITRARAIQYVYASVNSELLQPGSLLGAYLHFIEGLQNGTNEFRRDGALHQDLFASEVTLRLTERGFTSWTTYPIAGLTMDLVTMRDGETCAIDLVGYPGNFAEAFPLERYRMFQRAGLRIVSIPYSRWLLDPDQCLNAIECGIRGLHRS